MPYSIRHFTSYSNQSDQHQPKSYAKIINNNDSNLLLFVTGNSCESDNWTKSLCDVFEKEPSRFIKNSWNDLSFLEQAANSSGISLENSAFFDEKNQDISSSFISVSIEKNVIKYNLLGDNFLFIYEERSKKLYAYCSMIKDNGELDLTQTCHSLSVSITENGNTPVLHGIPVIGKRVLDKSICFVMSGNLAYRFIQYYKSDKRKAIDSIKSLEEKDGYDRFIEDIQTKLSIRINEADGVVLIRKKKSNISRIILNIAITIIILSLLLGLAYLLFTKSDYQSKSKEAVVVKDSVACTPILDTIPIPSDDYSFYTNQLNNSELSFGSVREMMNKAEADNLIEHNKKLYDTLKVYSEFVSQYKEQKDCYLRKAIVKMFQGDEKGQYTIITSSGEEISTNLTVGDITYFKEAHRRNLVELFIGKYDANGHIIQHDTKTKKTNYTKAVNSRFEWNSFSDMK